MVEQVTRHEAMIAFRVAFGQTNILVHIECLNIFEAYTSLFAGFYQLGIHTLGRTTRWKTQHKRALGRRFKGVDTLDYMICSPL